jgi:hypothetical protein
MGVTEAKRARRLELVYLFWLLAQRFGSTVRLYTLGERLEPLFDPLALTATKDSAREDPLPLLAGSPVARPGGIKILISDFLFPFEPDRLVQRLAGADRLMLVQLLTAFEADPGHEGQLRLEDAENGRTLDVALDRPTIEGYKQRLEKLRADMDRAVRLREGALAVVRDIDTHETMIRALLNAGMVEA